jgi:hypothetical protein
MMKGKFFVLLILLMTIVSCQSEFERQVANGRELARKEMSLPFKSSTRVKLVRELKNCAHLSGNEEVFNLQIKTYRIELAQSHPNKKLITKFP